MQTGKYRRLLLSVWIGGREVLLQRFASPIETLSFQAGCMFTLRCTLALPAARAHAIPCLQSATCAEMIKQSDQKERGLQITPKNQTNNKSLIRTLQEKYPHL